MMVRCHSCAANQEIGFRSLVRSSGQLVGPHQILAGNYVLGTNTKLLMPFQVPVLWLHLREILFLDLGLTVTEINIKKVETRLKKH